MFTWQVTCDITSGSYAIDLYYDRQRNLSYICTLASAPGSCKLGRGDHRGKNNSNIGGGAKPENVTV